MKLNKVILLGTKPGSGNIYCEIKISEDGRLSISGVEGPKANGDCIGSCGQIDMHLRDEVDQIVPAPGWDAAKLTEFFAVWRKWHLNDMTPGCEHQVGPEWTAKDVTLYHWRQTDAAGAAKKAAETAAGDALKAGQTFTPTPEQTAAAVLPYSLTTHTPDTPEHYQAAQNTSYSRATETKSTRWLNQSEHPDGFLSKPCPVCGYKYGTKHLKRDLPADVIAFLQGLPTTDKTPAWV